MNTKSWPRVVAASVGSATVVAVIVAAIVTGQRTTTVQADGATPTPSGTQQLHITSAPSGATRPPSGATPAAAAALSWKSVLPQLPTGPDRAPERALAATPRMPNTLVYAKPDGTAVGTLGTVALTGGATTVPIVARRDAWAEVLLPARRGLPSRGDAAAQSAGWMRLRDLHVSSRPLPRVTVHLGTRRIDIGARSWPIVIGAGATATPVTVTYIEDRWADQDEGTINLLGAFSTAADAPFNDNTGNVALHGLLGATPGSAVSHGCVRLPADALDAASALPLGTLVVVTQ